MLVPGAAEGLPVLPSGGERHQVSCRSCRVQHAHRNGGLADLWELRSFEESAQRVPIEPSLLVVRRRSASPRIQTAFSLESSTLSRGQTGRAQSACRHLHPRGLLFGARITQGRDEAPLSACVPFELPVRAHQRHHPTPTLSQRCCDVLTVMCANLQRQASTRSSPFVQTFTAVRGSSKQIFGADVQLILRLSTARAISTLRSLEVNESGEKRSVAVCNKRKANRAELRANR